MQRKKTMLSNNLDLSAHRPFHNIIVSSSNCKKNHRYGHRVCKTELGVLNESN